MRHQFAAILRCDADAVEFEGALSEFSVGGEGQQAGKLRVAAFKIPVHSRRGGFAFDTDKPVPLTGNIGADEVV